MSQAQKTPGKTAFVLAGGGSLGAVQVGMLKALTKSGVKADMVVGSSVGSINGAYYAGRPDQAGVAALEKLWRGITRNDIFPVTLSALARFAVRRDFLVDSSSLMRLIDKNIPFANIEDATLPLRICATNFLSGRAVILSSGNATRAVVASCAIPAAFAPVEIGGVFLADGGIANNSPVSVAVQEGATRLIVLPTGHSCSLGIPPRGAIASALHGLTLLVASQMIAELKTLDPKIEHHVVPSLCPVDVSPLDFSTTAKLIDAAERQTSDWLNEGGLQTQTIPPMLSPHAH